jgi:hypothetical protein
LSLKLRRRIPVPVPSIANCAVPVNVYRPAFTAVIRDVFDAVECISSLSKDSEPHSMAVTVEFGIDCTDELNTEHWGGSENHAPFALVVFR